MSFWSQLQNAIFRLHQFIGITDVKRVKIFDGLAQVSHLSSMDMLVSWHQKRIITLVKNDVVAQSWFFKEFIIPIEFVKQLVKVL